MRFYPRLPSNREGNPDKRGIIKKSLFFFNAFMIF